MYAASPVLNDVISDVMLLGYKIPRAEPPENAHPSARRPELEKGLHHLSVNLSGN